MTSPSINFTKIDKVVKPKDVVQWRRRVKAVISREDPSLLSLEAEPDVNAEKHDEWTVEIAKSKSTVVLCLGDSAMAKTGSAKGLWNELARIYTMSSTKAVENLQGMLESLNFKDGDWEMHISLFP